MSEYSCLYFFLYLISICLNFLSYVIYFKNPELSTVLPTGRYFGCKTQKWPHKNISFDLIAEIHLRIHLFVIFLGKSLCKLASVKEYCMLPNFLLAAEFFGGFSRNNLTRVGNTDFQYFMVRRNKFLVFTRFPVCLFSSRYEV
jgi:hypothetical protein